MSSEECDLAEKRHKLYARIAKNARDLLLARRKYLDLILGNRQGLDEAQEKIDAHLKALEKSVKAADDAKIWD